MAKNNELTKEDLKKFLDVLLKTKVGDLQKIAKSPKTITLIALEASIILKVIKTGDKSGIKSLLELIDKVESLYETLNKPQVKIFLPKKNEIP